MHCRNVERVAYWYSPHEQLLNHTDGTARTLGSISMKRERVTTAPPPTPPASPSPYPSTAVPSPELSASSSDGSAADEYVRLPGYNASWPASSYPYGSYDDSWSAGSESSSSSSSSNAYDNETITALDLLPKELRRIANKTRPDSDIPIAVDAETCYYYHMDKDACFYPRSCQDCLQVKGCMINQLGQCVNQTIDSYNGYMDFQFGMMRNMSGPHAANKNASRTQQYHFPAQVMPYCPSDEKTCLYCKAHDFKQKIDSRFCVGRSNGRKCLCISICESPVRDEMLVHKNCTNPLSSSTLAKELQPHPFLTTPSLFTLVVAPAVIMLVTYRVWRRNQRGRLGSDESMEGGAPRSVEGVGDDADPADSIWSWSTATPAQEARPERLHPSGRLDLFGWQAQRTEMIAKEQMLLAGLEDISPASRFVDFENTSPTAPDPDFEDSRSAPQHDLALVSASAPRLSADVHPATAPDYGDLIHHLDWDESDLATL